MPAQLPFFPSIQCLGFLNLIEGFLLYAYGQFSKKITKEKTNIFDFWSGVLQAKEIFWTGVQFELGKGN